MTKRRKTLSLIALAAIILFSTTDPCISISGAQNQFDIGISVNLSDFWDDSILGVRNDASDGFDFNWDVIDTPPPPRGLISYFWHARAQLEKNGRATLTDIARTIGLPLETVKYHFREHVTKRGLIEGYQVEIYRFPFPLSEMFFFKFEFDSHDQMRKFALALHDKPFPIFLGKVLGEDALVSQIYLPKWEFRMFVKALSSLIREGLLKGYHYIIQDMYQNWRQTIPYQHFKDGGWNYDEEKHYKEIEALVKNYDG